MFSVYLWVGLYVTEAAFSSTAQGRLQAAGIQLHDVRARKDQLAAQIRDAQAMLAMDTGTWLIFALAHCSFVRVDTFTPVVTAVVSASEEAPMLRYLGLCL